MAFQENPIPREHIQSPETTPYPLMKHLVIIPEERELPWSEKDQVQILQSITGFAQRNGIPYVTLCLTDEIEAKAFAKTLESSDKPQKTIIRFKTERGREEIMEAAKKIIRAGIQPDAVDEKMFDDLIDRNIPDPDFALQTGTNPSNSIHDDSRGDDIMLNNFMVWQMGYTEYGKTTVLLANLSSDHLDEIVGKQYKPENRRFGQLS